MINEQDYRQFTNHLFKPGRDIDTPPETAELLHAAVGVSTEAGELLDAVKKYWAYNKELDKENVLEECGDLLFYIEQALEAIGCTTSEARQHNYEKLNKRYPNGYSNEAAQDRADKSPLCGSVEDEHEFSIGGFFISMMNNAAERSTQNFLGDK